MRYSIIIGAQSTGLYLAAFGSAFYLVKVSAVSPVYPIIALSIAALHMGRSTRGNVGAFLSLSFLSIFVLASQFVVGESSAVGNFFFGSFLFLSMMAVANSVSWDVIRRASYIFCWFVAITHGADSVYRVINPIYLPPDVLDVWEARGTLFYQYKFNSIMYGTSNTTAVVALIAYAISSFLSPRFKSNGVLKLVLIAIIFSTFSRAAYLAFIFFNIYYFAPGWLKTFVIGSALSFVGYILVFYGSSGFGYDDLSFASKFEIISRTLSFFDSAKYSFFEFVFGIGFGRSPEFIGINTHNLLLTYALEGGLLGMAFLCNLGFVVVSRGKFGRSMFLMYLVFGLSYFPYAGTPFTFFGLGLAYIFDQVKASRCNPTVQPVALG